jgi:hypothetical protein
LILHFQPSLYGLTTEALLACAKNTFAVYGKKLKKLTSKLKEPPAHAAQNRTELQYSASERINLKPRTPQTLGHAQILKDKPFTAI